MLTGGGATEIQVVKRSQIFFGTSSKVEGFVKECREYIKKRMKREMVKDQILWVLTFVQRESTDM